MGGIRIAVESIHERESWTSPWARGWRETGHGVRIVLNRLLMVSIVALLIAVPSQAGVFKKATKPDPAIYVPALIDTLKSGKDEKARVAAAAELDDYDAKAFPDLLPALMEALASDPSPSVRSRAAESIGKVRPITAAAGYSLERAVGDDKSFAVRMAARTALLKYKVLGHMPGTKIEGIVQSAEPPLAAGPVIKDISTGAILRPTPPPMPTEGPANIPTLPPSPSPKPPSDSQLSGAKAPETQTGEPPLAGPSDKPTLVETPKAPAPVIVIPSPPAKDIVVPVPTTPVSGGGPVLPPKN
jgi:HEAT repeats